MRGGNMGNCRLVSKSMREHLPCHVSELWPPGFRPQLDWIPTCNSPHKAPSFLSFLSLTLPEFPNSGKYLAVIICICFSQFPVEPLRGQPCYALVCKLTIASIIVSGLGASPWAGSQFGPSILQFLLHFCPYISFRQDKFWVKSFVGMLVYLSLHCNPV